jgi:outer membrane protein TolC
MRKIGRSFCLALPILMVVFAGCASWSEYVRNGFKVGPNYCPPSAPVADNWIDFKDPNIKSDLAQDAVWWRTFQDPILDRLVQMAYRQNLTLRVAGLRILEARAQRAIVAGELFPQSQQAFGDYTRTGLSANSASVPPGRFFDDWTVGASLAWELDFWGRFRRAIEAADANLDASVEDYDDVLVLLISQVAQSYVNLRTSEQRLAYASRNVVIQAGSLNIATVKFNNGATTRLDVTQGQSNLSQTQSTMPPLESARRQAANQLCILLGMPPGNLEEMLRDAQVDEAVRDVQVVLSKPTLESIQTVRRKKLVQLVPVAPPEVAVGVPADLLRRRPDVRSAERQVAAQSALVGVATSELYPHFAINGTIFLDAARFNDLFAPGSFGGAAGPSFHWNILNYGRILNGIRVQDDRFQESAVQYQNTVLLANAEAENAIISFLKAQQQVRYLQESTAAAAQSLELVERLYDAGSTDFNRVFNIQQLLTQQQDQLAVAQGNVANSLILLYRALGGGWQIRLNGPAAQQPTPATPPLPPPLAEDPS